MTKKCTNPRSYSILLSFKSQTKLNHWQWLGWSQWKPEISKKRPPRSTNRSGERQSSECNCRLSMNSQWAAGSVSNTIQHRTAGNCSVLHNLLTHWGHTHFTGSPTTNQWLIPLHHCTTQTSASLLHWAANCLWHHSQSICFDLNC